MSMKKLMLAIGLLLVVTVGVTSVYAYSQGDLMAETLQAYAKGDFKEAERLAKKQHRHYRYAGVDKMGQAMKKAYKNVLKTGDISAYYLADLNNDGKIELVYIRGEIEASMRLYAVGYAKGKIVHYGSTAAGHSAYYAYPDHAGLVSLTGQMGYEEISLIRISKGKLQKKTLNHREDVKSYLPLGEALNSHLDQNGELNKNF